LLSLSNPFFKLYILGSVHTIHPEILLSKGAFNLLRELAINSYGSFSSKAILFTEHDSILKYVMEKTPKKSLKNHP